MKKFALLGSALLIASVIVFSGNGGVEAQAPESVKECMKKCKEVTRGCINAAEDNRAQARECRKTGAACVKRCKQECMKNCNDTYSGCMNAAEADKSQIRKCRKQNNTCRRSCR